MPRLSVVIPTYNRLDQLQKTLHGLANQSLPAEDFEVIVVSDGSTDGTNAFLQTVQAPRNLSAIVQENAGPAAARNRGAQAATGAWILFLDDDVCPDACLLQTHLQAQADLQETDVLLGPMLTPPGAVLSPWGRWEQTLLARYYAQMQSGQAAPTAREFFTGNVSINRAFFQSQQGFDPDFRRAEDVEFAFRIEQAGARFHFLPQAKGYHNVQRSYEDWLRIAYQYGQCDVRITRERGIVGLLPEKLREYHTRHPLIRRLVPLCLDRPHLQQRLFSLLRWIGTASAARLPGLSRAALSAIYNVRYYQGLSDQLGGREIFFTLVRQHRPGVPSHPNANRHA